MNIKSIKAIFDIVNEDCKKSEESVVPYSDVDYYIEQIKNVYKCSEKEAKKYAIKLANL